MRISAEEKEAHDLKTAKIGVVIFPGVALLGHRGDAGHHK